MRSFWWKKSGGTLQHGDRVSRQSPWVLGWLLPENVLKRHFEKYRHDMDLKLTEHVRNTIFLRYKQKIGWKDRYLELLAKKKIILVYISLKIVIFRWAMLYYVIVTSYVNRFLWVWYQWKEETLPYTMVPNNYTLSLSILNS